MYAVEHDSPLYYASESLVIRARNVLCPLKPTVRSEFVKFLKDGLLAEL